MSIHPSRTRFCLSLAAVALLTAAAFAQDPHAEKTTTTTTVSEPARQHPLTPDSVTEATVTVGSKPIAYKAVAGLIRVGASDLQGRHDRARWHDPPRLRRRSPQAR